MQEKTVIGIDISKKKFDVCLVKGNKTRHKLFNNNLEGFQKLMSWCKQHGATKLHFCMEATGTYGEALANFAHDLNHEVSVVNPMQIKSFIKSRLTRGKTDKSDANAIAAFCISHNPKLWHPQPIEERQLRDMYRCLQSLKDEKQAMENKLEKQNMYIEAKKAIEDSIEFFTKQINKMEEGIEAHIQKHQNLKKKVEIITEIKGIGFLTACALISEIPNVSNFTNVKQFAAFAGLTPAQHQSGSSINKRARISKLGSKRVRKALYFPALVVKNYNKHFKSFCDRLAEKNKPPKVIIIAVMRKILHIVFGMLKSGQKLNPNLI